MSSLGKVGSANAKSSQDMTGAVARIGVVVPLPAGMIHSNDPSISGLGEPLDTHPPPTNECANWDVDIYKMKAPLSCKIYLIFIIRMGGARTY